MRFTVAHEISKGTWKVSKVTVFILQAKHGSYLSDELIKMPNGTHLHVTFEPFFKKKNTITLLGVSPSLFAIGNSALALLKIPYPRFLINCMSSGILILILSQEKERKQRFLQNTRVKLLWNNQEYVDKRIKEGRFKIGLKRIQNWFVLSKASERTFVGGRVNSCWSGRKRISSFW